MALKLEVDSLDGIPDALKGEYAEKDGKFRLNVDGIEDTTGLKSALEKERKANKEHAAKIKRWEALGKSEDEIAELVASAEEIARKKAGGDDDVAKALKTHQTKWTKEKTDLETELNAARASERSAIVENKVMTALSKAGATEEGVDLLPDRLAGRITFETIDGKRVLKIMQADGEMPMTGTGKDGLATFDDLVKEAQTKWPSLFKGSGQSGSGKPPGTGGSGGKDLSKMSPQERITAARQQKAGK